MLWCSPPGLILHILGYKQCCVVNSWTKSWAFVPGNRCCGAIPDLFWTPCWRRLLRRLLWSCVTVFGIRYLVPKRRKQIKLSWHEISWDPLEPSKVSQNNLNQFSSENHASSNVCLKLIYEICLCMVWYGMERNVMKCSSIESNVMWCNAMKCNLT